MSVCVYCVPFGEDFDVVFFVVLVLVVVVTEVWATVPFGYSVMLSFETVGVVYIVRLPSGIIIGVFLEDVLVKSLAVVTLVLAMVVTLVWRRVSEKFTGKPLPSVTPCLTTSSTPKVLGNVH